MVIARCTETVVDYRWGGSGEWEWKLGRGGGGTIRLWRTALFYGESRSRKYLGIAVWVAYLAPSFSTNQQKHVHCEANPQFCPLPHSACDLGIMACLGWACWAPLID